MHQLSGICDTIPLTGDRPTLIELIRFQERERHIFPSISAPTSESSSRVGRWLRLALVSWDTLIELLQDIDLGTLADEIEAVK